MTMYSIESETGAPNYLLNPELDLRFGSAIFENLELNFRFSSGRFGFDPKFRTELVHH